ncbi:MAG: ferredoxin:glutaredoxin reductase [Proteobacteria bacterium]|nr:ferredoxin:glutaredoxin reductase [Pseudomonadota bacterium]
MINKDTVDLHDVDVSFDALSKDAESKGYILNPDKEFTKALIMGLIINKRRYGYPSCPCRLADEKKEDDLDIICPCNYRDVDLNEHGACYCALYVTREIADGKRPLNPIPERRPPKEERIKKRRLLETGTTRLSYAIWRCAVCGYLCAREFPPEVCPICKAQKERFEKLVINMA